MSDDDKLLAYSNAVLDAQREEDKRYIGIYSVDNDKCNKSHKTTSVCSYCRWNDCHTETCNTKAQLLCPACHAEICPPSCDFFRKDRFYGWMSICAACKKHGVPFPKDVPDDWKAMFLPPVAVVIPPSSAAAASSASSATAASSSTAASSIDISSSPPTDVIVIDDDPPPAQPPDSPRSVNRRAVATKLCDNIPAYWDFSSGNLFDVKLIPIFDNAIAINIAQETWNVRTLLQQGEKRCYNAGPAPSSMTGTPCFKRIVRIVRIQNFKTETRYANAKSLMQARNAELVEQLKRSEITKAEFNSLHVDPFEKLVFHGTSMGCATEIAEHGVIQSRNEIGVHGKGFYSSEPTGSAEAYANWRRGNDDIHTIIMGYGLVGKNTYTAGGKDVAPQGYDSGGNGTPWIYTFFSCDHFVPRYIIQYEVVSEDTHKKQLQSMQAAAGVAPSVADSLVSVASAVASIASAAASAASSAAAAAVSASSAAASAAKVAAASVPVASLVVPSVASSAVPSVPVASSAVPSVPVASSVAPSAAPSVPVASSAAPAAVSVKILFS